MKIFFKYILLVALLTFIILQLWTLFLDKNSSLYYAVFPSVFITSILFFLIDYYYLIKKHKGLQLYSVRFLFLLLLHVIIILIAFLITFGEINILFKEFK